jgi:uncharacterized protein YdeI (YjbR/CyaY-like superfamily)
MPDEIPIDIIPFKTPNDWRVWLEVHHLTINQGIWLRIYKKGSGITSVTYAEALEEALCFGWIDGQKKAYDAESWIQKFTPRRKRSIWSKVNVGHIERLEKLGKMMPNGWEEVEKAKKDGRWEAAYHPASTAEIPPDLIKLFVQNPQAKAAFEALPKSRRYSILFRLHTAKKPETREKHIKKILGELSKN